MMSAEQQYVHGYDAVEGERLQAQAGSVLDLLHSDTSYPAGARVLEVGCGTGAQTVTLAQNSPRATIVSIDRSNTSLNAARHRVACAGISNVAFRQADIFALPFTAHSFDHVFVCFVLEHLADPVGALQAIKRVLKPGGTITVFEGDHGSAYFFPDSDVAHKVINCQVALQRAAGGDAMIGRQLYPMLVRSGFSGVHVAPKVIYVDATRPQLVDTFTERTFIAMIHAVRESAITARLVDAGTFDAGIRALHRTTEDDGVFCYTFFKGIAKN